MAKNTKCQLDEQCYKVDDCTLQHSVDVCTKPKDCTNFHCENRHAQERKRRCEFAEEGKPVIPAGALGSESLHANQQSTKQTSIVNVHTHKKSKNMIMMTVPILLVAILIGFTISINFNSYSVQTRVFTDQRLNIFIDVANVNQAKEAFSTTQSLVIENHCLIQEVRFGDNIAIRDITHKMEPSNINNLFHNFKKASVSENTLQQSPHRSIVITDSPTKYSMSVSVLVLDSSKGSGELEKLLSEFLGRLVLLVSDLRFNTPLYTPGSILPAELVEVAFSLKNAHPTRTVPGSFQLDIVDEKQQRRSNNPRQTFGQDIPPGAEITMYVVLRLNTETSFTGAISSLFTELRAVGLDSNGEKFHIETAWKFDTKLLKPMFEAYNGSNAIIFPLGAPGVGKTTFRDTILYALGYSTSFGGIKPVKTTDTLHLSAKTIGHLTIMDSFGIEADIFTKQDIIRLARGGLQNTTTIDPSSKTLQFVDNPDGLRPNVLFFLYSYLDPIDHESYNALMKGVIDDAYRSRRSNIAFGFTHVEGVSDNALMNKANMLMSKENMNLKHTEFDPPKRLGYQIDSNGKPTTRMMLEYLNCLVELSYKAAELDPNAIIQDVPDSTWQFWLISVVVGIVSVSVLICCCKSCNATKTPATLRAVVITRHFTTAVNQLNLRVGDIVTLPQQDNSKNPGWSYGHLNDKSGWFPSSYVKVITEA